MPAKINALKVVTSDKIKLFSFRNSVNEVVSHLKEVDEEIMTRLDHADKELYTDIIEWIKFVRP